jgi:hypothetical protein
MKTVGVQEMMMKVKVEKICGLRSVVAILKWWRRRVRLWVVPPLPNRKEVPLVYLHTYF